MTTPRRLPAGLLAAGTASVLLLTACSSGTAAPDIPSASEVLAVDETAPETVELTVAFWGDFGLEALAERYEEENPGIEIVLEEGELNAHHTALQQQLVAGSGAPDVAAVDEGFIVQFREQPNLFVNLLDKGAAEYEEKYLPWKWKQSLSTDGQNQIGLGTDVGGLAMCYRHDLFEAAGLPADRDAVGALWDDEGWDGFIEAGKRYVAGSGGKAFVDNATNIFNPILAQREDNFFTEDEELVLDGDPKKAFHLTTQIVDAGLSAGITAWTDEWNEGFEDDAFAVVACPAWMTGHIRTEADRTAGMWDVATIPGGGGNWGGSFWTVPAAGDNVDEAYAFVEWLVQPDQQLAVFEDVGNLPAQPELYEDPRIQERTDEFFNGAPTGQIFAETAENVVPQYLGRSNSAVRLAVENALNDYQAGDFASANEAWKEAVTVAEEIAAR